MDERLGARVLATVTAKDASLLLPGSAMNYDLAHYKGRIGIAEAKGVGARCFLGLSLVDVTTGHPDHVETGQ